jgi:hypothetical protein
MASEALIVTEPALEIPQLWLRRSQPDKPVRPPITDKFPKSRKLPYTEHSRWLKIRY